MRAVHCFLNEQDPCDVPQGSILGLPLLYINAALMDLSTVTYSDDTVLHIGSKCPKNFESILHKEFSELNEWPLGNKFTLALDKRESMIFNSKSKAKDREGVNGHPPHQMPVIKGFSVNRNK